MAGLYLHVPFCSKRCLYCDFFSTVSSREIRDAYVKTLINELRLRRAYVEEQPIQTIYIGGGTPSLLSVEDLSLIFRAISDNYVLSPSPEVTIEINPDDVTPQYLFHLRDTPINRVSIGMQSLNDRDLRFLQRRHTAAKAVEAVKLCAEAGYYNVSIDLIYGIPGQTVSEWKQILGQALRLPITHLSAYALIYEENTPLWKLRQKNMIREVDEQVSLQMFECLMDLTLAQGFEHYEISNFARIGFRSRHNSSYWDGHLYLGCGPGAHSFNIRSRQWNVSDLSKYIDSKGDVLSAQLFEVERLTPDMKYNEYVLTSLRTCEGADLEVLEKKYGSFYSEFFKKNMEHYIGEGYAQVYDATKIRLTRSGLFISDTIMSDLLVV